MELVGLMECIDAIRIGESSFSTLKEVEIDGDATSNDFYWCEHNFVVVSIKVNKQHKKLKFSLSQNEATYEFQKSIDRCNTFYSNIFVEMTTLYNELIIRHDRGETHLSVTLIDSPKFQGRLSKIDYLDSFIELTKEILRSELLVDGFSLKSCIVVDGKLKVSLENRGRAVRYKDTDIEQLIAFKNFLVAQILYIITHYRVDNLDNFWEKLRYFSTTNYAQYNHSSYLSLSSYKDLLSAENLLLKSLFESTNFEYCIGVLDSLQRDISSITDLSITLNHLSKSKILADKEIIARPIEGRSIIKHKGTRLYGYCNEDGKVIVDCIYRTATNFNSAVAIVALDKQFGAIDIDGNELIPMQYDNLEYNEQSGVFVYCMAGKWGVLDSGGKPLTSKSYRWIGRFSDSFALFEGDNGKLGYLSDNGDESIEAQWDEGGDFTDGTAHVSKGSVRYVINKEGIVIKLK